MNYKINVGIRFADNDFGKAIQHFLENLHQSLKESPKTTWSDDKEENRKFIVRMFNETIFAFYLMHQNKFRYGSEEDKNRTREYLKIKESNVFVTKEEVENYLLDNNLWSNCEFHYFFGDSGVSSI